MTKNVKILKKNKQCIYKTFSNINPLTIGVHLSGKNYIGSKLRTITFWTINLPDLVHRDIEDCCLQ